MSQRPDQLELWPQPDDSPEDDDFGPTRQVFWVRDEHWKPGQGGAVALVSVTVTTSIEALFGLARDRARRKRLSEGWLVLMEDSKLVEKEPYESRKQEAGRANRAN